MFESGTPSQTTPSDSSSVQAIALDINFLPERHRGRRLRFAALRPWLVMVSFGLLLIPAWQLQADEAARLRQVESDFSAVSAALEGYQPLADERSQLEGRIATAEAEIADIQDAYDIVDIQQRTWSEQIPRLFSAAPRGIDITGISQSDLEITLEGLALIETLPAQYRDQLAGLGDFAAVTIQHVTRIVLEDPEATATPSATAEAEGEAEIAEDQAPPAAYSFEIRLELPAPPTPTPQPTATGE